MEYNFTEVENKWQGYWKTNKTFKTYNPTDPEFNTSPSGRRGGAPYYVLDMFPYPSGAGLHVGHPLGYIASDIIARYKRHKGFNVLHPMGYDSFGLPAEQYAIQTGQHPAITTEKNISRYREQLDKIGFSFDWDREVRTSNPNYYKWTQWIFIQLFNAWYNKKTDKAEKIPDLIAVFEKEGNATIHAACEETKIFSAAEWKSFSEKEKSDILLNYRLTYLSDTWVNWCPQLGTVLANEEVKEGVSERGGFPVERKLMKQWSMRITAYAERLLSGLDKIDWSESIKEAQRNWIGKSEGTSLKFRIQNSESHIEVFTTRPDTIFGVSFVTLAPEHELLEKITTPEHKKAVDEYIIYAKNRSERERQADVKKISGQFTGAYVEHPFTGKLIPVWVGDYVLAGYGTGAVMAVPAHDARDFAFANYFGLDKIKVIAPPQPSPKGREFAESQLTLNNEKVSPIGGDLEGAWEEKSGTLFNSDFLNGLDVKAAIKKAIQEIEKNNFGKGKTNFRLRDAIFGRQRYWGEPIPVYYKDGIPHVLSESELPLILPEVDKFLPTETGEPPLARAKDWFYKPLSNSPQRGESAKPKWQTAADSTWEELKERSNKLRNNPTESEQILWQQLKAKQLDDKFRRKQVIGNNIVDFVCLDKQLVVEVDGKIHDKQKEYDAARTQELESIGFKVIRFTNDEVIGNIEKVVEKIKIELDKKVLPNGEDLGGAFPFEHSTMPGWAGSSWYFLRYMDAHNDKEFAAKKNIDYWQNVDLYMGGAEHATGHLLYVRFWSKFLFDLGLIPQDEPAKKLINQGMIQGTSSFIYRVDFKIINDETKIKYRDVHAFIASEASVFRPMYISKTINAALFDEHGNLNGTIKKYLTEIESNIKEHFPNFEGKLKFESATSLHIDINLVDNNILNLAEIKKYGKYKNSIFVCEEDGKYICGSEPEKMSKSKYNVVNPDDICEKYGADCLRLYEMFLGPLEISKPWNTNGISGVSNFIRKLWRLYHKDEKFIINEEEATKPELKTLHKTIKKITEDIERFSFNTSVSNFMICVNELTELKCNKRAILEPLAILISPYAPHIAEELWNLLGHPESISYAAFPEFDAKYLTETSFNYPVSVNGKTRFFTELELSLSKEDIEKEVMAMEQTKKYLEGKSPKKIIIVPNKIVNIVI